ncbi:MAG: redox-sensing transcriptional repressor Rex [Christensenellales bacterium]
MQKRISESVIRRLPRYHRQLTSLIESGVQRVSSKQLGEIMQLTASQIRQDFNCLGGFGQQGYGYPVQQLRDALGEFLGLHGSYSAVIVGAGHIGSALLHYHGFREEGLLPLAAFDVDETLVGTQVAGVRVYHASALASFLQRNRVELAVICTPAQDAQSAVDIAIENGVSGIWNFAPVDVHADDGVTVENIRLSDSLSFLFYHLKNRDAD